MTQIKDLSPVDYASTNDQIPVYRPDRGDTRKMTVGQIYAYVVAQQGAQGSAAWGTITGTLSAQTDLQTALDGKQPVGNYQPLATVLTNTTASFTTALETKLNGITTGASVSSVALALPAEFSITGSPITTSGTLTGAWASQTANTFFAAPNGAPGTPTFRAIVAADIPTLNQNTTGSAATLTTARNIAMTGDVAWTVNFNGSGNVTAAGTIQAGAVTLPKMANLAANTIIGNNTGSAATPLALTTAQVKTLLAIAASDVSGLATVATTGSAADLTGTLAAARLPAFSGDITTSAGSSVTTLATVNASPQTDQFRKLTVNGKGLVTATSAVAGSDLNAAYGSQTANFILAAPNGAPGSPSFRALVAADIPTLNQNTTGSAATLTTARSISMTGDVTWTVSFNGSAAVTAAGAIANGAVTNAKMANVNSATIKGRITAAAGAPEDLTGTQVTTLLDTFTSTLKGLVPASGGGTANFLRADGTWAAPAGGGSSGAWRGVFPIPSAAGTYITQSLTAIATSTQVQTANRLDYFPFIPGNNITIDELAIDVTTAVASTFARICIHTDNNGTPSSTQLRITGDLDTGTNGVKAGAITPLAMTAGTIYWIGVHFGGAITVRGVGVSSVIPISQQAAGGISNTMFRNSAVTFSGGTPATPPALTANSAILPMVRMRLA